MQEVKTIVDKQYQRMNRMYSLLRNLGDDYVNFQHLFNNSESQLIDTMLSYYEYNEEYERCSYLLDIKEKLRNI